MKPMETRQQKLSRVAREIGAEISQQAGGRWRNLRTARRNEGKRHVWRFRAGSGEPDRYLHLSHQAMADGENSAATLLAQLRDARWLDRMQEGPETSFILAPSGRLRVRSAD